MPHIACLDQGTTSSRTIIVNEAGVILATAQEEFTQHYPRPGWMEHDAVEIFETQWRTFEAAVYKANLTAEDISTIGITNQRETVVVWDKETGIPIYPAIVWQDRRTADYCEQLKAKGLEDKIREKTGLPIDAYFSASKIKWLLENVDHARERAEKGTLLFGTIDTWLIWKLTNGQCHLTDQTNASRTMLYNLRELCWDEELLRMFQIPMAMLPEVKASSSFFGSIKWKGCEMPIGGVAGDQQAALFGQGCMKEGEVKNTYGTGCFMLMHQGAAFRLSQKGLVTTLACSLDGKPKYAFEGSVFVAGAAVQWLRDGLEMINGAAETDEMAREVEDDEVVMVPAFVGLGTPYWDSYARGAIFGLTRDTGKAHLAKSALQAIAFQSRDVFEVMCEESGVKPAGLKVDGGATANAFLMQFQADILGVEVLRSAQTEITALGAGYLAGLNAGIWTEAEVIAMSGEGVFFKPKMEESKKTKLYDQWKKAVSRTMGWLKE